jgi:hypothetical protein
MSRAARLMPAVAVLVAAGATPAVAACARGTAPATTATAVSSRPACHQPPEATVPGAAGALDETSSGAYCLPAGQAIDVFLHAADPAARWSPIKSSDPAVLRPQRTGVLTAPVGVTPGIFGGQRSGTATLSSSTPDGRTWTVTIVVG